MKKRIIIIATVILIILVLILTLILNNKFKYKKIDFEEYSIIDLNKNHKKYFLYEDRDYIYYIKGNPANIYYVTGSTDLVNDNTITSIKNGEYETNDFTCQTFNNKGNCYYVTNLVKYVYMNLGIPDGLENSFKIYKENRQSIALDMTKYELGDTINDNYLYYVDLNNIKLYLEKTDEYLVLNLNKQYKLSRILDNNKISLDDLYTSLRYNYDNTKLFYENKENNIDCILYDNNKMKICRYFKNNELYYTISSLVNNE